ncbi:recombination protein U [Cerasibacillus quisquiliarum]|uniref:Holliday junction resolvase RecU n=1 Tax=Cerasibacillus quisquiliarum TaxID=227865 RepID=A0A511UYR7_9BACI|nr:Holliday junction resolvase RecU [Cerasibacillus quisquiliarum]MBB5145348.1 recombination protein U [Cerasibacillus quisquiliarum]GEN31784.1 Holliday junction resolvase RecU [Cerasibacillus quisquiliarum]
MNYPNGQKRNTATKQVIKPLSTHYGNRGMSLEKDINITNTYYLQTNRAVIHKKPTPVQIVDVHYPRRSAAVIKEAYFKQASTTDYNGIYRSKYIDFEAKETKNKTSFPLANIQDHQIKHMEAVLQHGGICFFIIRFAANDETFLYPAKYLLMDWKHHLKNGRKSIPYHRIQQNGVLIPFKFQARVDYLSVVDRLYFK